MFKLTASFFVLAMMAAILGFTTDISAGAVKISRYVFFFSLGLMFLSAVIGATVKRQRPDRWE